MSEGPASDGTQSRRPLDGVMVPAIRVQMFRALYDAHVDFVWRNLRRLGISLAEVDDRTQEVFVVAHRRWDTFEDHGHGPRAWLFQIVLRVVSDARRHRRRHPEDADGGVAESRRSEPPTQLDDVARRESMEQLDRALETIDLGRRAVLVLHEIEEMTAPEIAKAMNLPLNTVYSRLRVAREELEQALHALAAHDRPSGPVHVACPESGPTLGQRHDPRNGSSHDKRHDSPMRGIR
jgi:RNA polymerase sigma-70 factor (ECF subfamily)